MRSFKTKKSSAIVFLVLLSAALTGCDRNFYLSEKEVARYNGILINQATANYHFDNLQGRAIDLTFDNSTGTPRLQSTNLLAEMRRTEMANLETGSAAISLDRLRQELEEQIGKWVQGRLQLYTNPNDERVRLTRLDSVRLIFLTNPTFSFQPDGQSIAFDVRFQAVITGEIEVNAVNWLVDFFTNINGSYPLQVTIWNLKLQGEANLQSPYANAGRIRFQLVPELLPPPIPGPVALSPIQVAENGPSVPDEVQHGVAEVLKVNLAKRVDEVFLQEYDHFTLPQLRLTPQTTPAPSRLEVGYRPKATWLGPDAARPQMHIVARGADGKLYHGRKSDGDWSTYSPIEFPVPNGGVPLNITSDPALVHSGNNQLELAATTQDGDLVYSHYRDEAWGNTRVIGPNAAYNPAVAYRGKPAVAASAPGQAEIIVAGSDGNLWHHRRINGFWQNPNPVPVVFQSPYRDPTAVFVGNKILVVFADGQNRLLAIAYDLETNAWGQATFFPSSNSTPITIKYAPAAVASGERRLNGASVGQVDVTYVKLDGSVGHRILEVRAEHFTLTANAISFRDKEAVLPGVQANASPAITCATYLQPEIIVRGTDNLLRHSHYVNAPARFTVNGHTVNPGWQNVLQVAGNLYAGTAKVDGRVSEYAAAGTRTGKMEIVTRAFTTQANSGQEIFHNEYESGRWGRTDAPWKTVHWRGWDSASSGKQLGTPALAVVDRNFEMANIGRDNVFGSTVHVERLAESNATYFLGNSATVSTVADPRILSTGPGMLDTIALRTNGRPEHSRRWSNGSGVSTTLALPAGGTPYAVSAVTYGNGFVELVATATDKRIYHWRYRDGKWSQPVAIATGIVSAPILLHTGAGQLELFGVDSDYHLFRWMFVNDSWQPRLSIAHSFRINETAFSAVSASSWGDGSVDLAVVNKDTETLHHRRIGPGSEVCMSTSPFPWPFGGCPPARTFSDLGGRVADAPVLTAFSPSSLNVLTLQGRNWHSSWAYPARLQPANVRDPIIEWSHLEFIGGEEMAVGGAAHTGRENFAAVSVKDGQFYINRNRNGLWTGFRPIIGQRTEQILRLPVVLPSLTSPGI